MEGRRPGVEAMDHDEVRPRGEPKIPGYRIEGVLGRGATGTVYRARQISVDREIALKVLHPDLVGAKGAERRLQREARTTARLAHPNIISAIDMGEVDGMWWYAMEFVDGESLQEKLRERPLNEREVLRTFIPLVEALQHAFERGVVHRDIKPANILIERGGRALLVDLGLAFADDDPLLTKTGATLGTPHYISPEQARDPSNADAQSDLWSLGATMYHAVCGRPPFSGDSVAEILSAVLYERVPDPSERAPALSAGFVLVLRKCLTRDRANRYATPAELLADLERIRERRAPSVRRSALEPVARNTHRRTRIAGGTVLVVAIAGVLGWLAFRGSEHGLDARTAANAEKKAPIDPLEAFQRAIDGPVKGLAGTLERANVLARTRALQPDELARLEPLRLRLGERLEAESQAFRRDSEARVQKALDQRRFSSAESDVETGLRRAFTEKVGAGALPENVETEFAAWLLRLSEHVRATRASAVESLAAAFAHSFDTTVAPKVESFKAAGQWRSARALLTNDVRLWIDKIDAQREGLTAAEIEDAVARLQKAKIAPLRERLDADWAAADAALAAAIAERVKTFESDLEARVLIDAPARLRQAWAAELSARELRVDEMPTGLLHLGHEALAHGEKELADLEHSLAIEDAQRGLVELEADNAELWKSRRYADVARVYTLAADDPWRAPVRATIELRSREARTLQELLSRAVAGVARRDGEKIELRVGSIVLSGKISAGVDPLRLGFRLTLDTGRVYSLALRPLDAAAAGSAASAVLTPETIERFADMTPEGSANTTPTDRLTRALLRMRDGDVLGARAALNAGPLPRDEPLVADLEQRLRSELAHLQQAEGERRGEALELLHLARREGRASETVEGLQKRIEKLLQDYGDVLLDAEIQELRRMRDERFARAAPSAEVGIADVFHPTSLDELANNRVRMRFQFDSARAGAFDPGAWIPDGAGWSSVRYAQSDEDMLTRAAPTLALRDPLRVQTDVLDVRLRLEQLSDAPPEVFLVSVAGFHVVLTGARDGAKPRCYADTGEASEALARARAGDGKEFAGWKIGAPVEVRMILSRARGVATIEVDGKRIAEFQRVAPRGDAALSTLVVRSWEPLRLISATIEAARR